MLQSLGWGALGWGEAAPRVLSPDKAPACMAAVPGAVGAAPDPLRDPQYKSLNLSTPGSLVCKVELMIILPLSWLLLGRDSAPRGGGGPAGTCALQDATGQGDGRFGLLPRFPSEHPPPLAVQCWPWKRFGEVLACASADWQPWFVGLTPTAGRCQGHPQPLGFPPKGWGWHSLARTRRPQRGQSAVQRPLGRRGTRPRISGTDLQLHKSPTLPGLRVETLGDSSALAYNDLLSKTIIYIWWNLNPSLPTTANSATLLPLLASARAGAGAARPAHAPSPCTLPMHHACTPNPGVHAASSAPHTVPALGWVPPPEPRTRGAGVLLPWTRFLNTY